MFRALNQFASILASSIRLTWFRMQFPGLVVGKKVRLGAGVRISVQVGATLIIGDRVAIEPGCQLVSYGRLVIGPDSFIGMGTVIAASQSIEIGRDALVAAHVTIRDHDHGTGAIPFREQPTFASPVAIGSNAWLGAGVVVLKGVTIGDNVVLGANAVATRDLTPSIVAVGIPARVVRHLDPSVAITPPPPSAPRS